MVIYQALGTIGEKFPQSKLSVDEMKDSLRMLLVLWQLIFGLVIFIVCIIFTHKIAGPLYKLKKYLTNLRNGYSEGKLFFRNGDYFQDVADEVNTTIETFQDHFKEDTVYISEAAAYLKNLRQTVPDDKKVVINEIVKRLETIEERFEEFIG